MSRLFGSHHAVMVESEPGQWRAISGHASAASAAAHAEIVKASGRRAVVATVITRPFRLRPTAKATLIL